jgi:hypothetical protein
VTVEPSPLEGGTIENTVYGAISFALIDSEIMLPKAVRAHIRDVVLEAVQPWLIDGSDSVLDPDLRTELVIEVDELPDAIAGP